MKIATETRRTQRKDPVNPVKKDKEKVRLPWSETDNAMTE
jgi:hypothetical protein